MTGAGGGTSWSSEDDDRGLAFFLFGETTGDPESVVSDDGIVSPPLDSTMSTSSSQVDAFYNVKGNMY